MPIFLTSSVEVNSFTKYKDNHRSSPDVWQLLPSPMGTHPVLWKSKITCLSKMKVVRHLLMNLLLATGPTLPYCCGYRQSEVWPHQTWQ